jgi:hypothetical protein
MASGVLRAGGARLVHDPANLAFMEAIMQGRCPAELDPGHPDVTVRPPALRRPLSPLAHRSVIGLACTRTCFTRWLGGFSF